MRAHRNHPPVIHADHNRLTASTVAWRVLRKCFGGESGICQAHGAGLRMLAVGIDSMAPQRCLLASKASLLAHLRVGDAGMRSSGT
jgi:hypothetical protein